MKPSIEKLHKILKLEAERGYDNRAVVGGLERIIDTWMMEARADQIPEELLQLIDSHLRSYKNLTNVSRAESLEGLWRRLERDLDIPPSEPLPPIPDEVSPQEIKTPPTEAPAPEIVDEREPPKPTQSIPDLNQQSPQDEAITAALDAPVTVLPNVGTRYAQTLERLGIVSMRDMLYNFPRRYDDYSKLTPINRLRYGDEVTIIATVEHVSTRTIRYGPAKLVEALISDGSATMRISWFNQPWLAKRLRSGVQYAFAGKVEQYLGRLVMNNPEAEPIDQQLLNTNRIVPVYSLTGNITHRWLRRQMDQVVSYLCPRLEDYLPNEIRRASGLVDLPTALYQIHFPDTWETLHAARQRLAFDEIFFLQLGVLREKYRWQARSGKIFEAADEWLETQFEQLPFPLTAAQQNAIADIRLDLASGHPMNRLLQGDVGSGKTVIAGLTTAIVCQQGSQAALMSPTSILAEQHYNSLLHLLAGPDKAILPEEIRLMIGATPESEKREIRAGLGDGSIKLVIGTHALIEDPISFADLELVIIDEQHRFGVEQRAALRSKGTNPHLLVMTATPIPRSLALTIYGDLDLTVMDEMPPGRQAVDTYVLTPVQRERAYGLIRSQVQAGRQAFIIYPLVEETDKSDAKAAVEEHARLQKTVFPNLQLGLLHGRLKPEEKDEVMARFHAGEDQILVSTSVVEVGVDVPNATVMLIEGANRFGLAQLHQFRGRVGRGADKSYCLLIPESADAVENERLQVMAETNDGFILAERDLEQRGPGVFLGTRQSGYADLQLASLTDVRLIEKARRQAAELFEIDPDLTQPIHAALTAAFNRQWRGIQADIS